MTNNKKVGIIAAHNIRFSPYIFYYTKILDKIGVEYELIYPNKTNLQDDFSHEFFSVPWNSKLPTLVNYAIYAKNVKKIVAQRKYDFLIVLTAINAVFLSDFLRKVYSKRYIVDIRDYSHENNSVYYKLECRGITSSIMTVVSSERFKEFLPKHEYLVCHNISFDKQHKYFWVKPCKKIVIGYVGTIAYKEQCLKLIDLVKKDDRFYFHVYGNEIGQPDVAEYISAIACDRIQYFGAYKPADKENIINSVDILFNAYGNGTLLLDTALSNKLYDCLYYKKLILTSPKTYLSEVSGKMAYAMDFAEETDLNSLYNWVASLNEREVQDFQDTMLDAFIEENEKTEKEIIKIIGCKIDII